MNILYIAFKGKNNASFQLVNSINSNNKLFLTNSFAGIEKDLSKVTLDKYDCVLMFGINKYLKNKLMVEVNASTNNHLLKTHVNYNNLINLISKNDIDVKLNFKPTKYLCNYAYYKVLSKNKNSIFIHIPGISKIDNLDNIKLIFENFE